MNSIKNPSYIMVPSWVTCGLFWAWIINDAEELVTMGPWSREHGAELARRFPLPVPDWVPEGMSETHVRVAISIMGCSIYALSVRGATTGGRSRLFQAALLGFGVHGVSHMMNSLFWGGYTPGVLTAPTVVIPYSALAMRRLAREGVLQIDRNTVAMAAVGAPGLMFAIHELTSQVLKGLRRR